MNICEMIESGEKTAQIPPRLDRNSVIDLGNHSRSIKSLAKSGLHVGCGSRLYPNCVNIDAGPLIGAEGELTTAGKLFGLPREAYYLQADLTKELPFDDASFEWIIAEHIIEHLALPDAVRWLKEMRRLLRPNGVFRISTPNLAKYVEGYADPKHVFFDEHWESLKTYRNPDFPKRRAWLLNQIFYLWGHKWIYDFEEIAYVAGLAGFPEEAIHPCEFRQGANPLIASFDSGNRRDESLYVELSRK